MMTMMTLMGDTSTLVDAAIRAAKDSEFHARLVQAAFDCFKRCETVDGQEFMNVFTQALMRRANMANVDHWQWK